MRKSIISLVLATAITACCYSTVAYGATRETPRFAPVNFWVGPVTTSQKMNFFIDFDLYMSSTTANAQPNAVALLLHSCNNEPIRLNGRTRHLAGGERLDGVAGGPEGPTVMLWSRPMGAPGDGKTVKLHLSFIGNPSGIFCLNIWDASELDGGRYETVQFGMK